MLSFNNDLLRYTLKFVDDIETVYECLGVSKQFYEYTLCNSKISQNVLVYFCAQDHEYEVKCLLKNPHIDPTDNHNEPLVTACINGSFNSVRLLCEDSRVNPNHKWNSPVIAACEYGQPLILKYLLEVKHVNITDQNNKGFRWACLNGHYNVVEYLLTRDDVDPTDGRLEIIDQIVKKGDWKMYYMLVREHRINKWLRNNRPELLKYTDGHYQ